jgi:hypothetical protein
MAWRAIGDRLGMSDRDLRNADRDGLFDTDRFWNRYRFNDRNRDGYNFSFDNREWRPAGDRRDDRWDKRFENRNRDRNNRNRTIDGLSDSGLRKKRK